MNDVVNRIHILCFEFTYEIEELVLLDESDVVTLKIKHSSANRYFGDKGFWENLKKLLSIKSEGYNHFTVPLRANANVDDADVLS